MSSKSRIQIEPAEIAAFCRKWQIMELSLFGSVLRSDFRPDSDVDVLVRFEPKVRWSLYDLSQMECELAAIFGQPVDLVERASVERSENYIRRREVLSTAEPVYGEG